MATSASQTYISKLGFQDRDRGNDRHGLACEYLYERLIEVSLLPHLLQNTIYGRHYYAQPRIYDFADLESKGVIQEFYSDLKSAPRLNVPIGGNYVKGFADVLLPIYQMEDGCLRSCGLTVLGEVKITKEPAEVVLQQLNFYMHSLGCTLEAFVLTDYDPSDLQRLVQGTNIKVFRLGQKFENWIHSRPHLNTDEL